MKRQAGMRAQVITSTDRPRQTSYRLFTFIGICTARYPAARLALRREGARRWFTGHYAGVARSRR